MRNGFVMYYLSVGIETNVYVRINLLGTNLKKNDKCVFDRSWETKKMDN